MYYCENCQEEFDESKIEKTTYEDFYEIGAKFPNKTKMILEKCPHCGGEDIIELEKCEKCGEYCLDADLVDTDEMVGGGIGYICLDCFKDLDKGGI